MSAEKLFAFLRYDVITLLFGAAVGLILLLRRFIPGKKRKEINALLSALYACLPAGTEDLLFRLEKALFMLFSRGKRESAAETVRQVLKEHSSLTEEEIAAAVAAVEAVNRGYQKKGRK